MQSTKRWVTFIVSLIIFSIVFAFVDVFIAGVFYLIVLFLEATEAAVVFKWVFLGLFILETIITIPCLYLNIYNERTEDNSGT